MGGNTQSVFQRAKEKAGPEVDISREMQTSHARCHDNRQLCVVVRFMSVDRCVVGSSMMLTPEASTLTSLSFSDACRSPNVAAEFHVLKIEYGGVATGGLQQ